VVHRTARCGLRVTRAQRERLFGLLRSAGDVWCCALELNRWRRQRRDAPMAGYQELCRELAAAGPGTFGELDSVGARSVLRRYSDAWFAAAQRRRAGDASARYPRRKRALVPVRWHAGTFTLDGRVLRIPVARGRPPLLVRLDRDVPYPAGQVRSVTLGFDAGRLYLDVTAEVPVATYAEGAGPDPALVAGVDLGIIHPYAVAGPGGQQLLVSGRAKPAGRNFRCPHCGHHGPRDLVAAANIAARNSGGAIPAVSQGAGITHRRAGAHLPGVHPARRDPRRRPPSRPPAHGPLAGTGPPREATTSRGVARHPARSPQARRPTPTN
jgi:transposase